MEKIFDKLDNDPALGFAILVTILLLISFITILKHFNNKENEED